MSFHSDIFSLATCFRNFFLWRSESVVKSHQFFLFLTPSLWKSGSHQYFNNYVYQFKMWFLWLSIICESHRKVGKYDFLTITGFIQFLSKTIDNWTNLVHDSQLRDEDPDQIIIGSTGNHQEFLEVELIKWSEVRLKVNAKRRAIDWVVIR